MNTKFIVRETHTSTVIKIFWKSKLELWRGFVVTAH